jgi:hypothetical protein
MKGTENARADILNKKLGYKEKKNQRICLFFGKTETILS